MLLPLPVIVGVESSKILEDPSLFVPDDDRRSEGNWNSRDCWGDVDDDPRILFNMVLCDIAFPKSLEDGLGLAIGPDDCLRVVGMPRPLRIGGGLQQHGKR